MTGGGRSGIVLREAGPFDAKLIAVLHLQCFADGLGGAAWSAAAIVQVLSLPGAYAYFAAVAPDTGTPPNRTEARVAGFLMARIQAGDSEILSLGVAIAWRRHGAARA